MAVRCVALRKMVAPQLPPWPSMSTVADWGQAWLARSTAVEPVWCRLVALIVSSPWCASWIAMGSSPSGASNGVRNALYSHLESATPCRVYVSPTPLPTGRASSVAVPESHGSVTCAADASDGWGESVAGSPSGSVWGRFATALDEAVVAEGSAVPVEPGTAEATVVDPQAVVDKATPARQTATNVIARARLWRGRASMSWFFRLNARCLIVAPVCAAASWGALVSRWLFMGACSFQTLCPRNC